MAISQEKYNLFADYVRGNLNPDEKKEFEKKLALNKNLAIDFKNFSSIINGIHKAGEEDFIQQLKEIDKQIPDPIFVKARQNKVWLYAASIVIIIGIGLILLFTKQVNNEKLYLAYFNHYKNNLVEYTRGTITESPIENLSVDDYNLLVQAMRHYDKKEYSKTIEIIEENKIANLENYGIIFFLALSQLESNRIDEAIDNLKYLNKTTGHEYVQQSKWYLSLAYLKNNEIDKAILELKEIAIKNLQYDEEAQKLLDELN